MSDVVRKGPVIKLRLTEYEATLLESLMDQLSELLDTEAELPPADDPFERWQAEFSETAPLDRSDPVIERLFPQAYPEDPAASAEFRRFTETGQRRARVEQAGLVMDALRESNGGRRPVQIRVVDLDQWLKGLTALRLSLAVRLGIEHAEDAEALDRLDDDDPRRYTYQVYEWLGYLTEALLSRS
ncbi:MAG: DUF2017 family protein [Propionicimonas sp.]|uniref:DUF2017 family protein n=1 Tax=Propionicimonas sp. TaxID=1955623 RepID=UPI002B2146AE|nr:DUF2017 family protein [Propionicimonas sp.]MEA4943617.1 DUF2017 family protein [Propionicimonas sp.]MEA5053587.1 DUF2017 family protein [Propionicimonas sp.]MEA5117908.1 DUF2017 family protein [Propionicimonas sp.]